jgi:sugar transferase (PEP-CTERM/EpsH1 system associated)
MRPRRRILMLMSALPYPPTWGSGIRNYQLARHLGLRHDVTLVTYATPRDDAAALEVLGRQCARILIEPSISTEGRRGKRGRQLFSLFSPRSYHSTWLHSKQLQQTLDRTLEQDRFDLIQIESSMMGRFDVSRGDTVVLLDEHNIEYEALYRSFLTERSPLRKAYYLSEYTKCRREEIASWRGADGCSLTSAREQDLLLRVIPDKATAVVPNAVDLDYFQPVSTVPAPDEIVFTGLMSYRPNVDAVTYFARSVLPAIQRVRPNAHFTVVGADPPHEVTRLIGPAISVTGKVADVRGYVARAALIVVPIRMGGGTRLKVAEGLAMGKPIVSTSLGAEGIGVTNGEHLLIADEAESFAEKAVSVLLDGQIASALGVKARTFAESYLSWSAAAAKLEDFHDRLLGSRRSQTLLGRASPQPSGRAAG